MENVTCPKCGQGMVSGFAKAPRGVHWRSQSQEPKTGRWLFGYLANIAAWWDYPETPAWYCPACRTLLIEEANNVLASTSM